jgi:hypothetical protein
MKWKISISILWLVFTVLFFVLAGLHFAESKQTIPKIEVRKYPSDRTTSITRGGIPIEQRLIDFGGDFNKYLDGQDKSNRRANLYACYGYLLAGLTAFVSMVLVWQEYIFALLVKLVLLVKSQKTSKNSK